MYLMMRLVCFLQLTPLTTFDDDMDDSAFDALIKEITAAYTETTRYIRVDINLMEKHLSTGRVSICR